MKFYNEENGCELSKEEFISYYEERYYCGSRKTPPQSRYVENLIDNILINGMFPEELALILAWKIGEIDNANSCDTVVYKKDFDKELKYKARYGKVIDVGNYVNYITENISLLQNLATTEYGARTAYNMLKKTENRPKGFGDVKVVTLLYFLSKGCLPIYDKFARKSLVAAIEEKEIGEIVEDKAFSWKQYNEGYIKLLHDIFGKEESKDRRIDRALWVYGHFFPDPPKK